VKKKGALQGAPLFFGGAMSQGLGAASAGLGESGQVVGYLEPRQLFLSENVPCRIYGTGLRERHRVKMDFFRNTFILVG
jgi:hypothetical protein